MFCPNTGTKFREPYHSNHVIPRLDIAERNFTWKDPEKKERNVLYYQPFVSL